ncbi:MAG TPA: thioredoxin domain-containing protein [Terriglobales bacterium]|nr:thioredoxin domain-containing protein [Terriglobales bacterium]
MKPLLLSLLAGLLVMGLGAWTAPARAPKPDPDPVAGNPAAAVRVIVYQDLECPDCARWHGVFLSQIIPRFGAHVAFVFRDYPLPQHLWSFNAAVIARYFDSKQMKIGMAWRDYCFTHQDELTPDNLIDEAARWAKPYGITRAELEQVFANPELFAQVQADQRRGDSDHVQHTPTVLLNGVEAQTPEQLEQMLEQALAARG